MLSARPPSPPIGTGNPHRSLMASHRAYTQRPRQSKPGQCLEFDYEALRKATNDFDKRKVNDGGCLLGEGGFGPVFRGILKQTEVAIKELRKIRMVG